MIDFKQLIQNESVEDVVLFLASRPNGVNYIKLDMLFVQFKQSVIAEGELLATTHRMFREETIDTREHSMVYFKGPKWREPKFMSEQKYGIE